MAKTVRRGFFRNAFDALVEARTRQANRYVDRTLSMLDKETLRSHGYLRDDLKN